MKIVLAGRGQLFRTVARAVAASEHTLLGVITPELVGSPPCWWVPSLARHGINSGKVLSRLRRAGPDLLLVASWGERLAPPVLSLSRHGCVNCHPSLLPAHRGPNPYLSAIVAGEAITGVTLHRMTERWDAGPILLQREIVIGGNDTGGALRSRCAGVASEMIPELLDGLDRGSLQPREQDEARASYFPVPHHCDLELDWRQPARRIQDRIRGVQPWLRCHSHLEGRRVVFEDSSVIACERGGARPGQLLAVSADRLIIATGDTENAIAINRWRAGRVRWPWRQVKVRVAMRFEAATRPNLGTHASGVFVAGEYRSNSPFAR